jgi:hypothetical protein
VSGGFSFFTRRVAEAAGFNANRANTLIEDGDLLAGPVGEPILGREAKLAALQEEAANLGIPLSATLAVGVGGNGSTEPSLAWAKADANASGQRSRSRPALPSRRNLWVTKPAKVALR